MIGTIEKVVRSSESKDGRAHLFLKENSVECISAAGFCGEIPRSGRIELHGEFRRNLTPPPYTMPYFTFTDLLVLS